MSHTIFGSGTGSIGIGIRPGTIISVPGLILIGNVQEHDNESQVSLT